MEYELSQQSLDYTVEVLLRHCKNKQKFKKDANKIASGGIDHSDYTNKGIRRSRISGKIFVKMFISAVTIPLRLLFNR
jgi:hypothetical protein